MLDATKFEIVLKVMSSQSYTPVQIQAKIIQEHQTVCHCTGYRKVPLSDAEREYVMLNYKVRQSNSESMEDAEEIDLSDLVLQKPVVNAGHDLERVHIYLQRLTALYEEYGGKVKLLRGHLMSDKPDTAFQWDEAVPHHLKIVSPETQTTKLGKVLGKVGEQKFVFDDDVSGSTIARVCMVAFDQQMPEGRLRVKKLLTLARQYIDWSNGIKDRTEAIRSELKRLFELNAYNETWELNTVETQTVDIIKRLFPTGQMTS